MILGNSPKLKISPNRELNHCWFLDKNKPLLFTHDRGTPHIFQRDYVLLIQLVLWLGLRRSNVSWKSCGGFGRWRPHWKKMIWALRDMIQNRHHLLSICFSSYMGTFPIWNPLALSVKSKKVTPLLSIKQKALSNTDECSKVAIVEMHYFPQGGKNDSSIAEHIVVRTHSTKGSPGMLLQAERQKTAIDKEME